MRRLIVHTEGCISTAFKESSFLGHGIAPGHCKCRHGAVRVQLLAVHCHLPEAGRDAVGDLGEMMQE